MDVGKYIVVWKRDGADWKIYRDMWSSNSQPQAPAAG
jgi:ketosteroid isomerase-like protein